MFFLALAKAHQESPGLRRLKRLIALLLAILVILLAGLAMGRPVVAPEDGNSGGVVILLDRSASMAATDAEGRDRLESTKAVVQGRIAGLDPSTPVTLIAYDRQPSIVVPRTTDRREIEEALASISVRPIADDPEVAMALAIDLAHRRTRRDLAD